MAEGFDTSAMERYAKDLANAGTAWQKAKKPFFRKEGTKLRSKTKLEAKRVGTKTGNYASSIKRGKVYDYNGTTAVRVYSYAPHAHLIEEGHRMVTHDGREVGFVDGHHVFEIAANGFSDLFYADLDDLLDGTVKKL